MKCRARGKRGKPNGGFPHFPPSLGNLATAARFPHFHRPSLRRMEKWKTQTRFPTFPRGASDDDDGSGLQTKNRRKDVGRCAAFSLLRFRAHRQSRFHAHPSIGKCSGASGTGAFACATSCESRARSRTAPSPAPAPLPGCGCALPVAHPPQLPAFLKIAVPGYNRPRSNPGQSVAAEV